VLDPATQMLISEREAMRLSWFATAGVFDADTTGRDMLDPATTTSNGWHAPSAPGVVHVWLVLHDSRGGVDFAAIDLVVR
jgi:hypothetical protein